MHKSKYLIVGSGAGGGTLARELSLRGEEVTVLEKGYPQPDLGTFLNALLYYDANKITRIPRKSKEGVILWRTIMAGGSTVVTSGNGMQSDVLNKRLKALGLDLSEEIEEALEETRVVPVPDEKLSDGSRHIRDAADSVGIKFVPMPKFVDPDKCTACGHCTLGCIYDARWTSLNYLEEAEINGARVHYGVDVKRVLSNGSAYGVEATHGRKKYEFHAENIILASGAMETPVILQKSGIPEAGQELFMDLMVNVYGVFDNLNMMQEPQMALLSVDAHESDGYMLSTFINHPREVRLIEIGPQGFAMPTNRLMGIMVKIADSNQGKVFQNGDISKTPTEEDLKKLRTGKKAAKQILKEAGVKEGSILCSVVEGAHPGGSAAIGKVVDPEFRTSIPNLYVCDASLLPEAPGTPPMITLISLAKRLGKQLVH